MLLLPLLLLLLTSPGRVRAHASEQGFVLLLPTDAYIAAGWGVVALTAAALSLLPLRHSRYLWRSVTLIQGRNIDASASGRRARSRFVATTRILSFLLLCLLIVVGYHGTRDPLENLLPLAVFTVVWVGLLGAQGVLGNVWTWVNPWRGGYLLLEQLLPGRRVRTNPGHASFGGWPACAGLLAFSAFLLADPAPDDPARLATVLAAYSVFTVFAMWRFGADAWLNGGEFFTRIANLYASLSPAGWHARALRLGMPGWRAMANVEPREPATAVFVLLLLGSGSFDGFNETFLWLALIDVNPLEFPGRSAIVIPTVLGLLAANALLIAVFALTVWSGQVLVRRFADHQPARAPSSIHDRGPVIPEFGLQFRALALTVLPIAFAYHIAHYLPSFLVNGQYALVALSDPFGGGTDWLGLGEYFVSTGFFNQLDSVRLIWLSQAAIVVLGHLSSVLMAHGVALEQHGSRRAALLALLPMTVFMVAYTFLGLWLLATARGV